MNFFWTRIHPSQYGFGKKRSATQQLLYFLNKLYKYNDLETTKVLSVLYLDFAKAFDTVPHAKLLLKLEELGLGWSFIARINSYLSEIQQYVQINQKRSHKNCHHRSILMIYPWNFTTPLLQQLFTWNDKRITLLRVRRWLESNNPEPRWNEQSNKRHWKVAFWK